MGRACGMAGTVPSRPPPSHALPMTVADPLPPPVYAHITTGSIGLDQPALRWTRLNTDTLIDVKESEPLVDVGSDAGCSGGIRGAVARQEGQHLAPEWGPAIISITIGRPRRSGGAAERVARHRPG